MFKWIARKPKRKVGTYLKYGFVYTEHENYLCPRCGHVLNAGPNYQPGYCSECGQKVTFKGIVCKAEKELGMITEIKRSVLNE